MNTLYVKSYPSLDPFQPPLHNLSYPLTAKLRQQLPLPPILTQIITKMLNCESPGCLMKSDIKRLIT